MEVLCNDIYNLILFYTRDVSTFISFRRTSKNFRKLANNFTKRKIILRAGRWTYTVLPNMIKHGPAWFLSYDERAVDGFYKKFSTYYWDVKHGPYYEYNEAMYTNDDRLTKIFGKNRYGERHGFWECHHKWEDCDEVVLTETYYEYAAPIQTQESVYTYNGDTAVAILPDNTLGSVFYLGKGTFRSRNLDPIQTLESNDMKMLFS